MADRGKRCIYSKIEILNPVSKAAHLLHLSTYKALFECLFRAHVANSYARNLLCDKLACTPGEQRAELPGRGSLGYGGAAPGKSQEGCLNYFLRRKASNGKCNPMLSKCGDVLKEQCYLVSLYFGEI